MEPNKPALTPPPQPAARKVSNGLAIAALVVGIIAFLTGLVPVFGLLLGVAAVILGIMALVKKQHKAMGVIGLILGAIAAITGTIVLIGFIAAINNADFRKAVNDAANNSSQSSGSGNHEHEDDDKTDVLAISNTSFTEGQFMKEVVGEIKNNDTVKHTASLKATFYGEDGKIVGTAIGSVTDLAPGETKTFNLVTTDDVSGHKEYKVQIDALL